MHGTGVDTFTFALGRAWLIRLFGRNPLIRASDRVEALILLAATVLVLVAAPVAGAVGTSVYDTRNRAYAEQALTRHTVTATVVSDSVAIIRPYTVTISVQARWMANGTTHDGSFVWDRPVRSGDDVTIWVDNNGKYAGPPASRHRAAADAIGVGLVVWLSVAAAAATLVAVVRFRLDQRRHADWARELRCLADDDGGRTNSQP